MDKPVAIFDAAPEPEESDQTSGQRDSEDTLRSVIEWIAVIVAALVIALFSRAYIVQTF